MKLRSFVQKYKGMPLPVKASLWYTVCNVLLKGISLLSMPIFTRIMTPEQFGAYSVFQSWYSIFCIFGTLNLFHGIYPKGLLLYAEQRERFTSSLLGLSVTCTALLAVIYGVAPHFWSELLGISPFLMLFLFLEIFTLPAVEFWAAKERFDYRYKRYVFVSLLTVVLSLGFGIVAVSLVDTKLEARVVTDVLAKTLFGAAFFVWIFFKGKCFFDKALWKHALTFNLPLIPHFLSTYVLNQSDRIMIKSMVGEAQAGFYSVAYTISTMMTLITTAINNALMPFTYRALKSRDRSSVRNATRLLFLLMGALCALTMAFAPEIITLFASTEYRDAIYVVPPVAASVYFIFVYSMFSTVEYYYQKTGFIAVASCVAALLNLILNAVFIPEFGYHAAGYTTLVSYVCLAFLHYVFYRKILKKEFGDFWLYDMKMILGVSIALLSLMILMVATYHWIFVRYTVVTLLLIIAVIKRKALIGSLKNLKKGEPVQK